MSGLKFDANGCTFTFSNGNNNESAIKGVNSITLPGWSVDDIDDTNLDNQHVFTSIAGNLKRVNAFTFNIDLKAIGNLPEKGLRKQLTITLPGNVGSFTCWGYISAMSDTSLSNGNSPVIDVTFTVGNLDTDGKEIAPKLTITQPTAAE